MTLPNDASPRHDFLGALAHEVPSFGPAPILVGIDGVDGSGKSIFAQDFARALRRIGRPAVVIHADDFLNLRAVRHRLGRDSPEGFWLHSYDYGALRRDVLEPLSSHGSGLYRNRSTDLNLDKWIEVDYEQALAETVVIVEGMFLHRDELVNFWTYSVFLDVPFIETAARMSRRDGSHADPQHPSMHRYVEGQRIYFRSCQPWTRATRIVDNADWNNPHFIEAAQAASTDR